MQELGINNLLDGKYALQTLRSNGGCSCTSLVLVQCGSYYDNIEISLDVKTVSATNETNYYQNDFSCPYTLPSRQNILSFCADIKAIYAELAEVESLVRAHRSIEF